VLALIAARVQRLLRRCGRDPWEADEIQADPLVDESPALAGLSGASVQGRIALGPRAGVRVWRLGDEPDALWVLSTMPRHAHLAGFVLHANVAVPAADRARLEQLCRYLLRPPVAHDRPRLLADGRVVMLRAHRRDRLLPGRRPPALQGRRLRRPPREAGLAGRARQPAGGALTHPEVPIAPRGC
jgi:Putative transposase